MHSSIRQLTLGLFLGLLLAPAAVFLAHAEDDPHAEWHKGLPKQHKSDWRVHDRARPVPERVTPGETAADAPSDAIVLFDGSSLDAFVGKDAKPAAWKVADGYMELNNTGDLWTKQQFGDVQLHLEFATPNPPAKSDQARGNSGIFFMNRYELQILDNVDNPTYADGYVGSVYGQHPALVNAGREPGQWNTYDVVFRAPRFNDDGSLAEPARITAFLNGVLVQHHTEVFGETVWRAQAKYGSPHTEGPIRIQDHNDKQNMRFRNIWIRELEL